MNDTNQTQPPVAAPTGSELFADLQRHEIEQARAKHRPINSAHEGYSVILEELDEFWEEVRKKRSERSKYRMVAELVQIAAMAQRTAEDVCMRAIASAIPPLPEGMSRAQAVLALRDLRDLATAAQAEADPGFKRWPTLDALIDHVAAFGLPPNTKASDATHE